MSKQEWLEKRRKGIGGSDVASVLNISPWRSRQELWMEKRGLAPDQTETPAMRRGTMLEPIAANMFMEQTGIELVPVGMERHPDHPFMVANMDRTTPDGKVVAEIKCPGLAVYSKIKREGLPDYWQVQLQHYLTFPGRKTGLFIILNAEKWELLFFEQEPDPELQGMIVAENTRFWNDVESGQCPPDEKPVIDLPPSNPAEIIHPQSPEWMRAVEDLREAIEIRKEAEQIETEAKETIKTLMNGAAVAESDGFRVYNQTQAGRVSLDTKRLQKDMPEIYAKYAKHGKPFSTLRPYFLKGMQI